MDDRSRTYIIAEAGVNHNGSLEMALELVQAAARSGADAVKFQSFKASSLVSRRAPKADYQLRTTSQEESQFQMLQRLELGEAEQLLLAAQCRKLGIEFLSSPFDAESLDLLHQKVGLSRLKIASGEITNAPLLLHAARTGKSVLLSTGMSTLADIEAALGVLAFGYCSPGSAPSRCAFQEAYVSPAGQAQLRGKVVLLHCTTEYPARFDQVNLRAMDSMRSAFGLPVGFSDHTSGIAVPLAAVARGACVIEKHFTLDRSLPGPDHRASLEPAELDQMVRSVREVEEALGDFLKRPAPCELKNMAVARKSLVALREIGKGEEFSEENLGVKRPGDGVSALFYWDFLGRTAGRDYSADEQVQG